MAWGILAGVKERLTGAIVLVALIVLLVPELLTGPAPAVPASETSGASVTAAPSAAGSAVRSYTLPLEASAPARAGVIAPSPTVPQAAPDAAPKTTLKATPRGHLPLPVAHAILARPIRTTHPDAAQSGAKRRPAHAAPRSRSAARSEPHREGASTRGVKRLSHSSRWVVQLGVFALHADALRMQRRARARGIAARVGRFRVRGRVLWRVTVGPVNGQAAGRSLARRLRAHGLRGELRPE